MLLMPGSRSPRAWTRSPTRRCSTSLATWSSPRTAKATIVTRAGIAKRAEAYLKSTGLGDAAYFGPEPEFFIFDSRNLERRHVRLLGEDRVRGSAVVQRERYRGRQHGASRSRQGRLLSRCRRRTTLQDIRNAMCLALEQQGVEVEVHHHEVAAAGQNEIGTKFAPSGAARRLDARSSSTRCRMSRIPTARRRPSCPSPSSATTVRACTCTSRCGKAARICSPAIGYAGLSDFALYYIGGIIKHAKALNAITNPGTNSYKRLVPGFEAPINLAYSARTAPRHAAFRTSQSQGPPRRGAFSGSDGEPVPRFAAMLMAGLDGVQNKIHPGDPIDKNIYDLPPEVAAKVPHPCAPLDEALESLRQGPRVPDPGRRVLRGHDRRIHRRSKRRNSPVSA